MKTKILVLGSGSWGLALAQVLNDNNNEVFVYGNDEQEINELKEFKTCKKYFPDIKLSENIKFDNSLERIFNEYNFQPDILLIVVPSNAVMSVLNDIKDYLNDSCIIVNATKGFTSSGHIITDVIKKVFENTGEHPIVSLLGPSHAEEVINRQLTFVNIVDPNQLYGYTVSNLFNNSYFKSSVIPDELAAQLCVSFKNIVAFLSGIFTGLGYGDNARAALFSMGLIDMYSLVNLTSSSGECILGLIGAGDLAVTCYSNHSRNFTAGKLIGELDSFELFLKDNKKTVEGINAAKHFKEILPKHIQLPIIKCVNKILEGVKPSLAVNEFINNWK